ncbi:MAG: aspartate aminotransferase family protein [Chloroflexi bacterium]|nr:aspartate aminotransferase family protein [Chloroflexota bacterium]
MSYQGLKGWMESETFDGLRASALSNVWFPFQQWNDVAGEGGLRIITEGHGAKIVDFQGKEYYDGFAGLVLVNVGYGREEIARAVYDQISTLHYANTFAFATIPVIKLAEKLASITPGDLNHVFLTSGGSDSVETSMKMARQYHVNRGEPKRSKFISRKGSYHGVSLGALSVNTAPWVKREIFEPMLPTVRIAPQPSPYRCELGGTTPSECAVRCAEAVEKIMLEEGPETIAAVIAEPVSVSTGVAVPGPEYWPMLRDICDRHGVLLIADEVINGFGRTGKMFGMEHFGVVPDMITVAKGITSGYQPVGACITRDHVAQAFVGGPEETFQHGYTYSGHPAGAAAALVNIDIIEREDLVGNSARMGEYLLDRLTPLREHPIVGDIRGLGLMCALDLVKDKGTKEPLSTIPDACSKLTNRLADNGLLTRVSQYLILTPVLTVSRQEVDEIVDIVSDGISYIEKELGY